MRYNKLSIIAFILSIVPIIFIVLGSISIPIGNFLSDSASYFLLGAPTVGIILGFISLHQIRRSDGKGKYLAYLSLIIPLVLLIAGVVVGVMNMREPSKSPNLVTKAALSGLRMTGAEAYYTAHGSYGPTTRDCLATGSMFTDKASNMSEYTNLKNYQKGTILSCDSEGSSYAVAATLTGSQKSWCVDSKGNSMMGEIDPITHLCKSL